MTSNPPPPIPPVPPLGDGDESPEEPTREVEGERELDPDANPDLIDSADADRIAAEGD
ncbi:hypothetical protein [Microbacterium hydrocarbonoxydans]|uniref:hypothetical protein n=1 Tax=Microbacterium hydrocarbonoxydans TaxID=273678 RepID=UPI002040E64A|nr:hypothetical protein [Microbacterium hydrocarbonoxydans]MCM3780929.1 hypothetical protein [Microbacterium hydrocarbonoxydans]